MNYQIFSKPKILRKTISAMTILGLLSGSLAGLTHSRIVHANNGIFTYAIPGTETLVPGDALEVHMTVTLDPNDTNPITSPSCLVNGVEVKDTFTDMTSVNEGHFRFTYTVGSGDANRAAGQVPINCTLQQTGSVTVTAFDDNNTVAIDTDTGGGGTGGNDSGGSTTSLSISEVTVSPSSGTSTAGDLIEAFFREVNGTNDLAVTGTCQLNGIDVASSFANLSGGLYKVSYTVGPSDGERPAGHIPVGCSMANTSGSVTAAAWTDGNTLAIDTNGDGAIDNGTNNLGFTVTVSPSSGTLLVGDSMQVDMQDPLPSGDVVIGSNGCRINDVDVSGSYSYQGNGLYRVNYTVASGNAGRPEGEIPFDCTLENHTGSVHLVAFTDSNTLAIDASGSTGGGGDTGGGTGGTGTTTEGGGTGTTTSDTSGNISGDVESGATTTLAVTSIDQVEATALSGSGYDDGWVWVFNITVPSNETSVQAKFNNWTATGGSTSIAVANNMRISSAEASSTSPVTVTAAGSYSAALLLTGDLDPNTAGRQIQLRVEMQIPDGTANGSYTTGYTVRSFE